MRVDLFDFELPSERIAQAPCDPRDAALLLVVGGACQDRAVADLPDLLRPGDLLVCNDTRVLPTRFWGRRDGVPIEATLIEAIDERRWWALCRPGKRLHAGDVVTLGETLVAEVEGKAGDGRVRLAFALSGDPLLEAIRAQGAMPLPPYIKRPAGGDPADRDRYQAMFARRDGSVAAPTASLHFTPGLLERLRARGVEQSFLTLHVGLGTFAPVKVEDTSAHRMHAERCEIPEACARAIEAARSRGSRIIAVGSTVLRALESAAEPDGSVRPGAAATSIFITPGWRFRTADLLLTNFHLPRSTLFMLVCAFGGTERLKAAYAHAIAHRYRFFSYGDACLIERGDAGP
jgi:S-adenosylmethionine:tRNA ribosyltransferase-isomerase